MKKRTPGNSPDLPVQDRGLDNTTTSTGLKKDSGKLSHYKTDGTRAEHRRKISESMKAHWARKHGGEPAPRKDRSEYPNVKSVLPRGVYAKCSCGSYLGTLVDFQIHTRFCEEYQRQHAINRLGTQIMMVQKEVINHDHEG